MISAVNAMTLTPSRAAAIFRGHESGRYQTETLPRWGWALLIGYAGFRLLGRSSVACHLSRRRRPRLPTGSSG
jgi:hypothetical protein